MNKPTDRTLEAMTAVHVEPSELLEEHVHAVEAVSYTHLTLPTNREV